MYPHPQTNCWLITLTVTMNYETELSKDRMVVSPGYSELSVGVAR